MTDKHKELKANLTKAKRFVDEFVSDKDLKIDELKRELLERLIEGERKCWSATVKSLTPAKTEEKEKKPSSKEKKSSKQKEEDSD